MALKVLNLGDLERELRNRAARLFSPEAQEWLKTVPKNYLLNVDGSLNETDKQENFAQYHREWERHALDGVPEALSDWVEQALQRGETVFVYDPVQPMRRQFWKRKIERIVNWFNSSQRPVIDWGALSFEAALKSADEWYREQGLN